MNWISVAMYVSWLAALLALISASIKPQSDYRHLARYKWRWVAINLLGVIPFLGLVTATAYVRCVLLRSDAHRPIGARVRNPGEPAPLRPPRRPAGSSSGGSYQFRWPNSSGSAGPVRCGVCNGRGWHYSDGQGNKMTCYKCGGRGYL
jgi:hypothetical protein